MSSLDSDPMRVVLVTGALGGIGRAVCKFYHDRAFYVIGTDRLTKKDDGFVLLDDRGVPVRDRVAQPLSDFHGDRYHQIDFEVPGYMEEDMEFMFSDFERLGDGAWKLEAVVHCAAFQHCGSIMGSGAREVRSFDKTMEINVGAIYHMNQALYPLLKRDRGSVVVIGSVHTVASSADISLYAISKCALVGLVRNTCIEWARDGIRINMVSPGAVNTPMLREGLSRGEGSLDENFDRLARRYLDGRIAEPSEVASIVYFLGDRSASGLINGQNIVADGGVSCVLSTEVS